MNHGVALIATGLAWTAYAAVHSVLASDAVKAALRARSAWLERRYRLAYNVFALVSLAPVLWVADLARGPWLWRWTGAAAVIADALALACIAGFAWTLRYYDGRRFLGLAGPGPENDALVISPAHRIVRHPWYTLALIIVWTRDMDAARALSACVITAYLLVGSRLEERKLERQHGEAYARYRQRVPGLVPVPWRVLSADEARALESAARFRPRATT